MVDTVISIKITPYESLRIQEICNEYETTKSVVVRAALDNFFEKIDIQQQYDEGSDCIPPEHNRQIKTES